MSGRTDVNPPASSLLRALVVDFDGTLTEGGRPRSNVLERLAEVRAAGHRVVLATGRIFAELLYVFPDVLDVTDSVVCENGGVLVDPTGSRTLASPIPASLVDALAERGVILRRGEVLLAGQAHVAAEVLDAVHAVGLDVQLVFNRAELMVLPAAVSKASGVTAALRALGLSPHNAVAIGDAENDLALLQACEIAVAPRNAIDAVKAAADLVLEDEDGAAVADLAGRLVDRRSLPRSRRWTAQIGTDEHGQPVRLPISGTSLLVSGGTSSGKSYLAGLIAEQLIGNGYETLVIDPEGDHVGLRGLPNVVWFGGSDLPRRPRGLAQLRGSPLGNVVADLSHLSLDDRIRWMAELPAFIADERAKSGSPHWVVIDEAHLLANDTSRVAQLYDLGIAQYCLVTFLPDLLEPSLIDRLDAVVLLGNGVPHELAERIAANLGVTSGLLTRRLLEITPGVAITVVRDHGDTITDCRLGSRRTDHVRHWHKYATERKPASAFHFRSSAHRRTGATAANLSELHDQLIECDGAVVAHHAEHGDFSRWIHDVIADEVLAQAVSAAETNRRAGGSVDAVRNVIVDAIRTRYLTD